jgi:hypothetical protein
MLEHVHDLYDSLEKKRIMLSFKGDLTPELVTALLALVERRMQAMEPDAKARKRVFNVVMECLQNLYHHNVKVTSLGDDHWTGAAAQGVVMIGQNERGYSILTGNFMASEEVTGLRAHLDRVNDCDPGELRDLYQRTLNNGRYGRAGGGGSGIIDIARKSGRKLEYGFVTLNEQNAFFSLNVNVTT